MSLEKQIASIQEELTYTKQVGERLQVELDFLREQVKLTTKTGPKLWVPDLGEYYYSPSFGGGAERHENRNMNGVCVGAGLAFQSEADAAEVGKYLVVVGKLCNLAKTANAQFEPGNDGYFYSVVFYKGGPVVDWFLNSMDRPRFHSRKAAEWALSQLTENEKATLIRGIS